MRRLLPLLGLSAVGLALSAASPATARSAGPPLWVRVFSHFEYLADRDASAAAIRRQAALLAELGIPAEQNLHRGEIQAAYFAERAPDVLEALRAHEIAYHPHPMPPYRDRTDALRDLPWDEAVAKFRELERCAVDFSTGALDCDRVGGAAAVTALLGEPLVAVCDGGPYAVSGYVWRTDYGIRTRLGSSDQRRTEDEAEAARGLFGEDVAAYWYMGALVWKNTLATKVNPDPADVSAMVAGARGDGPVVIAVVGTDKVAWPGANEYAAELWRPGMRPEDLIPPPDRLWPTSRREAYWQRFAATLRLLRDEVRRRPGSRFLTPTDALALAEAPTGTWTRADVTDAARRLSGGFDRPPLETLVAGRPWSLVDVWEGLARAVVAWRTTGRLPDRVEITGILGPVGDPMTAPAPGDPARRRAVAPDVLAAAVPDAFDRVPWALSVGPDQDEVLPAEQIVLLARLVVALDADGTGAIDRPTTAPWVVPSDLPERRPGFRTRRWGFYTELQYWTAKRVRWKEG